ncbi:MAG: hypothetical protein ACYTFY_19925, partial [Planctomycetota bacterium]
EFRERVNQHVASLDGIDFEKTLYYFSCLQMEMHKAGMELCRKHRENCGGNVIWMFADAYTGFTRTIVDYYLREKPAYYALKRACAALLVTAEDLGDQIEISAVNDSGKPFAGELEIEIVTFDGQVRHTENKKVTVAPDSAEVFITLSADLLQERESEFLLMRLVSEGAAVCENRFFFNSLRKLKFPLADVQVEFDDKERVSKLEFSSQMYARNICINIAGESIPEDNCFDLFPGRKKSVFLNKPAAADEITIDWENRQINPEQLLKKNISSSELYAGCLNKISFEIFNPDSENDLVMKLSAFDQSGSCLHEDSDLILSAGESRVVDLQVLAPGLSINNPEYSVKIKVEYKDKSACFTIPMRVVPPLSVGFAEDSVIYKNLSENSITAGLYHSVESCDGRLIGEKKDYSFAAGEELSVPVNLSENIFAWSGYAALQGDWGEFNSGFSMPAVMELPEDIKLEELAEGTPLKAYPVTGRTLSLCGRSGYILTSDSKSSVCRIFGGFEGEIRLFLSYDKKNINIECFLAGEKFTKAPVKTPSRGASLEAGLALSNDPAFEACLSMNDGAGFAALRKIAGEKNTSVFNNLSHFACSSPETELLYLRFSVKWSWIDPGYGPQSGDKVKCAFVFNSADSRGLSLYGGIIGKKDISSYGDIVLK